MNLIFGDIGAQRLITLSAEVRNRYVKRIEEPYLLAGLACSPWMGLDAFLEKGEMSGHDAAKASGIDASTLNNHLRGAMKHCQTGF